MCLDNCIVFQCLLYILLEQLEFLKHLHSLIVTKNDRLVAGVVSDIFI